jgi:hypothetical protein
MRNCIPVVIDGRDGAAAQPDEDIEASASGKCFSPGVSWRCLAQLAHLALLARSRQLMPESPPESNYLIFIPWPWRKKNTAYSYARRRITDGLMP